MKTLKTYSHNGKTIRKVQNQKTKAIEYKSRFQIKGREFRVSHISLEKTKEAIDKKLFESHNETAGLDAKKSFPTLREILSAELQTITNHKKKVLYKRVFKNFADLLPASLRIDELTPSDINAYIEFRQSETSQVTRKPIKNATINKELSCIRVALRNAKKRFRELSDYSPIPVEKLPNDYEPRVRTVRQEEFERLFEYLYQPRRDQERRKDHLYRIRLGHWIEFAPLSGLRRKEIATLRPENYSPRMKALINFDRHKTKTITDYFPLPKRACEIIEERIELGGEFIFSEDGKPIESHYRSLKKICKKLNIQYGSFTKGGFVLHDLRRNFATEIVRATDIETAREFLGHADLTHTGIYLATDKKRMKDAIRKFDKIDLETEVKAILKRVKSKKLSVRKGTEKLLKLFGSR